MNLDDLFPDQLQYAVEQSQIFQGQMRDHKPYVAAFCQLTGYQLLQVTYTLETGEIEPAYEFTDGLGIYTIVGIKETLKTTPHGRN
jgi:hypothetical protein